MAGGSRRQTTLAADAVSNGRRSSAAVLWRAWRGGVTGGIWLPILEFVNLPCNDNGIAVCGDAAITGCRGGRAHILIFVIGTDGTRQRNYHDGKPS